MKVVTKSRVVAPADITIDRTRVVVKGDRGIVLAERGLGRNRIYDIVFTSTAESAVGYPLCIEGVPASAVIPV
ncbi:MAG TPA: hypothetical protein VF867_00030 [Arthrobacter sp.]